MNHPTWKPATIPARPPKDPNELPPFEWTAPTTGLEVAELSPSDLSPEQRAALGIES